MENVGNDNIVRRSKGLYIKITLTPRERVNLDVLLEKYGGTAPEYFRRRLDSDFRKEYGSYKSKAVNMQVTSKKKEDEMTVEQYCENQGGVVKKDDNGVRVCFFQTGYNKLINKPFGVQVPLDKKAIKRYVK